jgi:hypothetical protein
VTTNSTDLHPVVIPGYEGGPYTHRTELLEEPLFWLLHISSCAASEEAQELLFGADYEAGQRFGGRIFEAGDWPTFTLPLADDHRFHIVYRTFAGDAGVDYLLHHPEWEEAELLATDDGHFMGPALSWPELTAIARNGLPGGTTADSHARLLLLLPAVGDDNLPDDAVATLAAALASRTVVSEPDRLAVHLLDGQGSSGPAHWVSQHGVRVNDGDYSFRAPANRFALPPHRLARVSRALQP